MSVTVPPFALALDKTKETKVVLVLLSTKSTFKETVVGQSLVSVMLIVPCEKEAVLNELKPPLPYVPTLLWFTAGKGAFEPWAVLIAVKLASFATFPSVIALLMETELTGMVPIVNELELGLWLGKVKKSLTLSANTLSWATTTW